MAAIPTVSLPSGEALPALGQGTWKMGESRARRKEEVAALRGKTVAEVLGTSGGSSKPAADVPAEAAEEVSA